MPVVAARLKGVRGTRTPASRHKRKASSTVSRTVRTSAVLDAYGNEFVPQAVDASVVQSQLAVIGASVGLAAYWWYVLVPSERGALSREKRKGELRAYLEELDREAAAAGTTLKGSKRLERWFYEDWLRRMPGGEYKKVRAAKEEEAAAAAAAVVASASAEEGAEATPKQEELEVGTLWSTAPGEGGVTPNFWSFDNPIVAAFTAVVAAGVFSQLASL